MRVPHLIICLIGVFGCQTRHDDREMANQIMETDKEFNKMVQDKGFSEAAVYYADEMVIFMQEDKYPIVGKYELMMYCRENPCDEIKIRWEPLRAEASVSIGYTYGTYQLQSKTRDGLGDSTIYGNYVSVWKKKRDGSWRYVVDAGNDTPGPVSLTRKKQP